MSAKDARPTVGDRVWRLVGSARAELRHAVRALRRAPVFAGVTVVVLGLATCVNLVTLGMLNDLVLRPLAVDSPETLFQLRMGPPVSGALVTTSYPAFQDIAHRTTTLRALAAYYAYSEAELTWAARADTTVRGYEVSGNYFEMLGLQPQAGRFFTSEDEHGPDSAPYIVLSDALWRRTFGGDRSAIGATVAMNGHPFTILGVASAEFRGTERLEWPDYWIPLAYADQLRGAGVLQDRSRRSVAVLVRLAAGVTPAIAVHDIDAITAQLAREYPRTDRALPARLIRPGLFGDDAVVIRRFLIGALMFALLLVLAAALHGAALGAARLTDRSREFAIRASLGASRFRLLAHLLIEALLLAGAGGSAGLVCALAAIRGLNRWTPSFGYGGQRLGFSLHVDARVAVAWLLLILLSTCIIGGLSAWRLWRAPPAGLLKRVPEAQGRGLALRDLLLVAQITVATLLIAASFVAAGGVRQARQAAFGFEPGGAVLAEVDLRRAGSTDESRLSRVHAMLQAVRDLPGMEAVAAAESTPLGGGRRGVPVFRPGTQEGVADASVFSTRLYPVSSGYFVAAKTRVLRGRGVSEDDASEAPAVAVINETFARSLWPSGSAVGEYLRIGGRLTQVVGVVEDGKYHDLMESPQPAAFVPLQQYPNDKVVVIARASGSTRETIARMERVLAGHSGGARVVVRSWNDALASTLFPARAGASVLGGLGVCSVVLAVTGVFGIAAYGVSRRMRELSIRAALGASAGHVVAAAVGRPLLLLGAGSFLGVLATLVAGRVFARLVYHAEPADPVVLLSTGLAMIAIGLAGTVLPAARALHADPARLMREE